MLYKLYKKRKKEKKIYHERLDLKNVAHNKEFWKNVKPYLSDQVTKF